MSVSSEAASAAVVDVRDTMELLVEGCIVALGEHSTEALLALVADEERFNGDGWLARMVRDYLSTWRNG